MAEHHSAPQITSEATLNGNAGNSGKIRASHLLVKHKCQIDAKDKLDRTALLYSLLNGHESARIVFATQLLV